MSVIVKIPNAQGRHEEVEIATHTNDTLMAIKRQILRL